MPPIFIGAFDAEKIAFVDYSVVANVFIKNDFNWNVTPSNHSTKEFKYLLPEFPSKCIAKPGQVSQRKNHPEIWSIPL